MWLPVIHHLVGKANQKKATNTHKRRKHWATLITWHYGFLADSPSSFQYGERAPVRMLSGQKKHMERGTVKDWRRVGGLQQQKSRGRAWCKWLGLKRRVEQLFGMHRVEPDLYWSWHPGNYDERWLYHDCNCKCKSCGATTLFFGA